jgi:hypothetical protein
MEQRQLPTEVAAVIHPGIRRIFAEGAALFNMLPIMSFPNLHSVALKSFDLQQNLLQAFFERSGASVRTLGFIGDSLTIAKLFPYLPSLRHVQTPSTKLLEILVSRNVNSPLLESFFYTLRKPPVSEAIVDAMLAYAQHRWAAMEYPTPLTIKIRGASEFRQDNDEPFQRLRACQQVKIVDGHFSDDLAKQGARIV